MTENVRQLRPLVSIPHMLKVWSEMFESGEKEMPKSVVLVCVPTNGEDIPSIYVAGTDLNRCEEIGALFTATRIASETQQA